MTLSLEKDAPPLLVDRDGVVRVGGTRVTLDTAVAAFEEGLTAEEVVQQYPALTLADADAAITYYLRHRKTVEDYLAERRHHAETVRRENEARFPGTASIRARLLARQGA